jgi:putative heme-binding domain-containing protein
LAFAIPHAELPSVEELLFHWLDSPALQEETLRALLLVKPTWAKGRLTEHVASSLRVLVNTNKGSSSHLDLTMRLAQSLRLSELEPDIVGWMNSGEIGREAGLRALIEMSSSNAQLFQKISASSIPGSPIRRLAVGALASVNHEEAFAQLLLLWPALEKGARKSAIAEVLASPEGAARVLTALENGVIALDSLDGIAWARLEDHLGQGPRLQVLKTRAAMGRISSLRFAGGGADFVDTNLTIDGPFTMESWMYLESGISNDDSLLALPGQFDFNFWDGYARLWGGPSIGDVIVATQRAPEERWFHIALTRTASGILSLYIDGELNQTSTQTLAAHYEGLDLGRSSGAQNTHGRMVEVRLWNVARSAAEIGSTFRRSFSKQEKVDSLIFSSTRQEVKCMGEVAFEPAFDPPPLQTAAEIEAELDRFTRFRRLANTRGDLERGGQVFAASCLACHRMNGEGGSIGPALDGVGAKGVEGLLRSILTPNAGVESGYRTLMVQTHDGQLLTGFLAGEDAASISIRRLGREDFVLPRSEIKSMRFDPRSLMPEGLLDGLSEQSVSDLFDYLKSQ